MTVHLGGGSSSAGLSSAKEGRQSDSPRSKSPLLGEKTGPFAQFRSSKEAPAFSAGNGPEAMFASDGRGAAALKRLADEPRAP
ncbi:hypothetical protein GN956_G5661 [Arapaima gigas]